MTTVEKIELIKRNADEVMGERDLPSLFDSVDSKKVNHYIGFEISGKIHLGTGLICMSKVKDLIEAEVNTNILLADWHSWINDKLGGEMETIQRVGVGYFKEGLKASLLCLGGDPSKVNFVLGTDLYAESSDYWATFVDVCKNTTLSRIKRSISIMGRKEGESVDFARLLYPPMQVADIFAQEIHFPHGGMDQRKAHVVARDVAEKLNVEPLLDKNGKKTKPIAIHTHLILGLGKPPKWPVKEDELRDLWVDMKMSKSKPDTCVFIHDTPEDIERKIMNAFCPEGEVKLNPILDWTKHLIFNRSDFKGFVIDRPSKFGGKLEYKEYEELEKDFKAKQLHPQDLKAAVAQELIRILKPARDHFAEPENRKKLEDLEDIIEE